MQITPESTVAPLPWGPREVEHLWNRAGFGLRPGQVQRWVKAGPEALVEHLLAPRPLAGQELAPSFEYDGVRLDPVEYAQRTVDERRVYRMTARRVHAREFARLRTHWVRRIVAGEDPLRDRMTLFWHGVFTSSYETVKPPGLVATQHLTLRRGALGTYEGLLRAMLRDPAMLVYLNNDQNKKGKPNENLAREVMELFSLGEGSGYTEQDVQEAARALTGATVVRDGDDAEYRFRRGDHDGGMKVILGVEGRHRPDDLAGILVARAECATFIAKSLLEYLEGVPADDARTANYARHLRSTGYDISHVLRALFLDPAFYRPEVVGARIASPMDYLIGMNLRLGADAPPQFLVEAAGVLGQELFRPPNVKGWEEGVAWVSTASFMLRGNIAGALLGRINRRSVLDDATAFMDDLQDDGMMAEMSDAEMSAMGAGQAKRDAMSKLTKRLEEAKFKPQRTLHLWLEEAGARTCADVVAVLCGRLLAIEPPAATHVMLTSRLEGLCMAKGIQQDEFVLRGAANERLLADLGHFILSLPEAQLH